MKAVSHRQRQVSQLLLGDPFLQGGPWWLLPKVALPLAEEKEETPPPRLHKLCLHKSAFPSGILPGYLLGPYSQVPKIQMHYACLLRRFCPLATLLSSPESQHELTKPIIPTAHWRGWLPPLEPHASWSFSGTLENTFQSSLSHSMTLAIQQSFRKRFEKNKADPNPKHFYLKRKKVLFIKPIPFCPLLSLMGILIIKGFPTLERFPWEESLRIALPFNSRIFFWSKSRHYL